MEEYILYLAVAICSFLASLLTFFSGFGLGTLLLVVFGFFLPIELAVFSTAIVHFLNAAFKLKLIFNQIDWKICISFGLYAVLGSIVGSMLLLSIPSDMVLYSFPWKEQMHPVRIIDFVLASVITVFAFSEFFNSKKSDQFNSSNQIGGFVTGLMGGFSGHQGAVRSFFLSKHNISSIAFAATSAMLSFLVDIVRIGNYSLHFYQETLPWMLISIGVGGAFLGSFFGKNLIEKTSMPTIRKVVRVFLLVFACLKFSGFL